VGSDGLKHSTALDHRPVGLLDGSEPGGDPGLAGGDGLAVAPTVGTFGQARETIYRNLPVDRS
jgi:hypothetical protein